MMCISELQRLITEITRNGEPSPGTMRASLLLRYRLLLTEQKLAVSRLVKELQE